MDLKVKNLLSFYIAEFWVITVNLKKISDLFENWDWRSTLVSIEYRARMHLKLAYNTNDFSF